MTTVMKDKALRKLISGASLQKNASIERALCIHPEAEFRKDAY